MSKVIEVISGNDLLDKLSFQDTLKNIYLYNQTGRIIPVTLKGVFKSNIPLFNQHVAVSTLDYAKKEMSINELSGIILSKKEFLRLNNTNSLSYKERYLDFFKWLDTYEIPIIILISFIIIICFPFT